MNKTAIPLGTINNDIAHLNSAGYLFSISSYHFYETVQSWHSLEYLVASLRCFEIVLDALSKRISISKRGALHSGLTAQSDSNTAIS